MTDFSTTAGFNAPRAADFLTRIRETYEADPSTPNVVNWENEAVLGNLSVIMSVLLDEVAQGTQAVFDSIDSVNAQGYAATNIALLRGTQRNGATNSQVAGAAFTGTAGTVVPPGTLVQGGGSDGRARWSTSESLTLDGAGEGSADLVAVEEGPTAADAGSITTIVSVVSGLDSVTNPTAAVEGLARELDSALLLRSGATLNRVGGAIGGIQLAVLDAVPEIRSVVVLENDDSAPATISGVVLPGNAVAIYVYDGTPTGGLTTAQLDAIGVALYTRGPVAGVKSIGALTLTVTAADGSFDTFGLSYATPVEVDAGAVLTFDVDVSPADEAGVIAQASTAITEYFSGLVMGSDVLLLDVYGVLAAVDGLRSAAVTLDGLGADVVISSFEVAVLGTLTVTS